MPAGRPAAARRGRWESSRYDPATGLTRGPSGNASPEPSHADLGQAFLRRTTRSYRGGACAPGR